MWVYNLFWEFVPSPLFRFLPISLPLVQRWDDYDGNVLSMPNCLCLTSSSKGLQGMSASKARSALLKSNTFFFLWWFLSDNKLDKFCLVCEWHLVSNISLFTRKYWEFVPFCYVDTNQTNKPLQNTSNTT